MAGTCPDLVDDAGYAVDEVEIVFHGVCARCRPAAERSGRNRSWARLRR
ncbi:hypothetical protein ACFQ34_15375 [Pseudonocardia benzenivorans]|uniref:Uncharacterized protein n=1 Tax=Pseudonocardia benzenivorans TaxID=228005 RepID=A0ABW3VIU1_9PSEU|nr:hypothetical protein [Pseudonocardia dioxanivorans]